MPFVIISTFDKSIDAHLVKSKLESECIECFLFDEYTVSINPLYNLMAGGIKLCVMEENVIRARAVLDSIEHTPFTDIHDDIIHCPACHSTDIYNGIRLIEGKKTALIVLLSFYYYIIGIALFLILYQNGYICKSCGKKFRHRSTSSVKHTTSGL